MLEDPQDCDVFTQFCPCVHGKAFKEDISVFLFVSESAWLLLIIPHEDRTLLLLVDDIFYMFLIGKGIKCSVIVINW